MLKPTPRAVRVAFVGLVLLQAQVWAAQPGPATDPAAPESINDYLARLRANPAEVMNEAPPRWDANGAPDRGRLRFSPQAIESGAAIAARDAGRARMCMEFQGRFICLGETQQGGAQSPRAPIRGHDLPETVVDGGVIEARTLEALERRGLTTSKLPSQPWSDDYWGFYKGVLGARYGDPEFPASKDREDEDGNEIRATWRQNRGYIRKWPAHKVLASGDAKKIDALSPSEKYELLIGDTQGQLTSRMWRLGEYYQNQYGQVESWMGICHGWGFSSFMLPRPQKVVTLPAARDQKPIRFYPADLKALATLLWANGDFYYRFIGGRCNAKNPKQDANGRVIDPVCFDNNPATWHLAVTHQIGLAKRSMVLDATYDYEVWNQPVLGYTYKYFNPKTDEVVDSIVKAKVTRQEYAKDPFRRYRSSQAVSIVGIAMDVTYMVETTPAQAETDDPSKDDWVTVRYFYDLELDGAGNIIGGEWYNNRHPDFLWAPVPGARAVSVAEDMAYGTWDGSSVLPASWRQAAIQAAQNSQPLAKLVEQLISLTH